MHNRAPRYFDTLIYRLSTYDTCGSYFVTDLARLVKYECEYVLVIGNGDDGLYYQLAVSNAHSSTCAVVRVFPPDSGILLVNTNNVLHGQRITTLIT